MATLDTERVRDGAPTPHFPLPDLREEDAGRFLGRVPPGAPVGSFGNVRRRRWQGGGTFRGDPDRQREGSFGDHDLTKRTRHRER
jgi:hypothetical protein